MDELNVPGFGWSDREGKRPVDDVILINNDRFDSQDSSYHDFVSRIPIELFQSFVDSQPSMVSPQWRENLKDAEYFRENLSNSMLSALKGHLTGELSCQYREFEDSGWRSSQGRRLKWHIMIIKPNVSFKLHAHPNIELILVLNGTMHELRLQACPRRSTHRCLDHSHLLQLQSAGRSPQGSIYS